jgi:serine/threonine protein phosphatase PrpC
VLPVNAGRGAHQRSRSGGARGAGGAGGNARGARSSAGGVPLSQPTEWGILEAATTQAPRWSSAAEEASLQRQQQRRRADGLVAGVNSLSTVESVKRSSDSTLPPVKLSLANRSKSYKDLLYNLNSHPEASADNNRNSNSESFNSTSARKSSTQPQRWKDTWGPGASTVPPDPTTKPKVEGFDVERRMVPAAFNGFVTASGCSWGGREKDRWKKENQDTFIISPDCKGAGGRSDGRGASRAAGGGPGHGRRSNRHSTGSTSPVVGAGSPGGGGSVGDSSACLLAVLDGHGTNGRYVSTFVRDHLLRDVCEEVDINANQGVDLFVGTSVASNRAAEATIAAACRRADQALRTAPGDTDVRLSGSTLALAVVTPHAVLTACVGDSRVVLGRAARGGASSSSNGQNGHGPLGERSSSTSTSSSGLEAVALTRDHKPEDPRECTRILAANGRVAKMKTGSGLEVGPPRVFLKFSWTPGLAVSRAFGDLLAHEVGVTSEPEVATRDLEVGDEILVLASDGVWEHLTDQQVIDIAAKAGGYCASAFSSSSSFDDAAAARAVCAASRVAWTKESASTVDDITAVVAHFAHELQGMAPPRLASTAGGRAARMSIGAMMKAGS